jgi:hypothetical protein
MTGTYQADYLIGYAGDDILMGGKGDKENYNVSSTPPPSPTPSPIRTAGQTVSKSAFFVEDGADMLDGGTGIADWVLELSGTAGIVASDFIL